GVGGAAVGRYCATTRDHPIVWSVGVAAGSIPLRVTSLDLLSPRHIYSGRRAAFASWITIVPICHSPFVFCNKYTTPARSSSCPSVLVRTATPPAITVVALSRLRWRLINSLLAKPLARRASMIG